MELIPKPLKDWIENRLAAVERRAEIREHRLFARVLTRLAEPAAAATRAGFLTAAAQENAEADELEAKGDG